MIIPGVEASTRKSFSDYSSLMLGKARIRINNLTTSLRFPCLGLNPIIDSINLRNVGIKTKIKQTRGLPEIATLKFWSRRNLQVKTRWDRPKTWCQVPTFCVSFKPFSKATDLKFHYYRSVALRWQCFVYIL